MCESKSSGGGGVGAFVVLVIGGVAVAAYLANPTGAPPAKPVAAPAPVVVHAGFPWMPFTLAALAVAVLAVLATLVVVRLVRRRAPAPLPVAPPRQAQRALTQAQQRPALTARATTAREQIGVDGARRSG
jgi:hypothetical protein